jgi:N-carbamoyl-L-amino-acid hydrolase
MIGSGVFAGVFDLAHGLSRADAGGITIGEELKRIGYAGEAVVGHRPVAAFFEAHIEQGPILEAGRKTIGIVRGVQGIRWFEVTVTGQEAHAGPTPMPCRRDALVGAAAMVAAVRAAGLADQPHARATVGMFSISPNSRNVIPGTVCFTVDLRHPEPSTLEQMSARLAAELSRIATENALELLFKEIWYMPPVKFDAECVAAVEHAAKNLGFTSQDIISGAGHDAVYLSRIAPTAMIFVPCKDGISHNETEDASPEDLAAGCAVLLAAMVERANAAQASTKRP